MRRLLLLGVLAALPARASPDRPDWVHDVAPIVNRRCVGCHHPGELAPMALDGYRAARPWAKAIRDEVAAGTMPPWFADPQVGAFANDARLAPAEAQALVRWAAGGAPEGKGRAPEAPRFHDGWTIGAPDAVVELPAAIEVPAREAQRNRYVTVDSGFTEDRWVSAIEIRPTARRVVHHVTLFIAPGGRLPTAPAVACSDAPLERMTLARERASPGAMGAPRRQYLYSWTPGGAPFRAGEGAARRIPAGAKLIFELHYAPDGQPAADRTRVGFVFARGPVERASETVVATNESIAVPPGDPAYQASACLLVTRPVTVRAVKPHMHLRGRDMRVAARFPDGREEPLVFVPRWSFDWQLTYELARPLALPAGTHLEVVAHWDNSAANKANPDPTKWARWDEQSTGEMLAAMITVDEPAPR